MSTRDEIVERLVKLKALADGGVGGERENAAALLEQIASKYGISLSDLDRPDENNYELEFLSGWQLDLMRQLCALKRIEAYGTLEAEHCLLFARMLGVGRMVHYYYVRCTAAEWAEIRSKFDVLARDYRRQRRAFFRAFLEANDLLVPASPDDRPLTARQKTLIRDAYRLATGIIPSSLHPQIDGGDAEGGAE